MNGDTSHVEIKSRDYWFRTIGSFMDISQHWALIDTTDEGVVVWFFCDASGVFDKMMFPSGDAAVEGLQMNEFEL